MARIFKYFFIFIMLGVIWFFIFSIQVSKNKTIFLVVQKEMNMLPEEEEDTGD